MGAEELVARRAPEGVRRGRIRAQRRSHPRVQIRDASAPVEQRDVVLAPFGAVVCSLACGFAHAGVVLGHRSASAPFAKSPPMTRATVGNAWMVSASVAIGVRSLIARTASWIASDAAGPAMKAPTSTLFFRSMTIETCPSDSLT